MDGKKMIAHQAWIAAIGKAVELSLTFSVEQETYLNSLFEEWWEQSGSQLDKLDRVLSSGP